MVQDVDTMSMMHQVGFNYKRMPYQRGKKVQNLAKLVLKSLISSDHAAVIFRKIASGQMKYRKYDEDVYEILPNGEKGSLFFLFDGDEGAYWAFRSSVSSQFFRAMRENGVNIM